MSTSRELLFIGGAADGCKIAVPDSRTYTLPFTPGPLVERAFCDFSKTTLVAEAPCIYYRHRFYCGARTLTVMAHTSLTGAEVVEKLIEGYSHTREEDR